MKRCAICRRELTTGLVVDKECLVRLKRAAVMEYETDLIASLEDAKHSMTDLPAGPEEKKGYLKGLEIAMALVGKQLAKRI